MVLIKRAIPASLSIFLLLSSFSSHSQVYKFKAFQTCVRTPDDARDIEETDWNKTDILVVINIDKGKIKTFGNKQGDYDIISVDETVKNNRGDNVVPYIAVDDEGNKCRIEVTIFNDQSGKHTATMNVIYPKVNIVFRLKRDE